MSVQLEAGYRCVIASKHVYYTYVTSHIEKGGGHGGLSNTMGLGVDRVVSKPLSDNNVRSWKSI